MQDAKKEYQKKVAVWKSNSDTLMAEWKNELKAYEKEHKNMTKKERELKEELLRNKQAQINQYQEAIKQKSHDEEQVLSQTAVNAINDYIKDYGKKHGYKYIIGATGQGNLLYANEDNNLTDIIIEGLNKEYDLDNPSNK